MSTVAISIRCFIQRQLVHGWMGQTPCGKGFVGSNEISVRISVTSKEIWFITVDTFAHCCGGKCYDGYSITLIWQ